MEDRLPKSLPVAATAEYVTKTHEKLQLQLDYDPGRQLSELTLKGSHGTQVTVWVNLNALLELMTTAAAAALADPGAIGLDAARANPRLSGVLEAVAA